MAESRTELLAWLNDLLQLNYRKIEQAGTGTSTRAWNDGNGGVKKTI